MWKVQVGGSTYFTLRVSKALFSSGDTPSKVCGGPSRSLVFKVAATIAIFGTKRGKKLHRRKNDERFVTIIGFSSLAMWSIVSFLYLEAPGGIDLARIIKTIRKKFAFLQFRHAHVVQ